MHVYDSFIIGSGYSSIGFALTRSNCIICEEQQCCDTSFYLPLKSFIFADYTPQSELGKKLQEVFQKYHLFENGYMCTNGFEPALCEFLSEQSLEILLKSRVVNIVKDDNGIFKITVYTSEGLCNYYAKNVYDTTSKNGSKYLTALFSTEDTDDLKSLKGFFDDCIFTEAFYKNRYAVHFPAGNITDVNEMMFEISKKWKTANTNAKILYVAPTFAIKPDSASTFPLDMNFANPIEAFEAGISFSGGEN